MSEYELKPCPFCGGAAEIITGQACLVKTFSPVCKDKKCMGRARKVFRYKQEAVKAWNKRGEDGDGDSRTEKP